VSLPRKKKKHRNGQRPAASPTDHVSRAAFDNRGIAELMLYINGRNLRLTLGGWLNEDGKPPSYLGFRAALAPVRSEGDGEEASFTTAEFAKTYRSISKFPLPAAKKLSDTITHLAVDADRVVELGLWIDGIYFAMHFGMIVRNHGRDVLMADVVCVKPHIDGMDAPVAQFPLSHFELHYANLTGSRIVLPDGVQA